MDVTKVGPFCQMFRCPSQLDSKIKARNTLKFFALKIYLQLFILRETNRTYRSEIPLPDRRTTIRHTFWPIGFSADPNVA